MATIEELRALLANATPPPWEVEGDEGRTIATVGDYGEKVDINTANGFVRRNHLDTAALIVAAVNALPALLDLWDSMLWHNDETCVEDSDDNCRICCALAKLGSK